MSALPLSPKLASEPLPLPAVGDQTPYSKQDDAPLAPEVRIGAWQASLCSCCELSASTGCMAYVLPCVSLAQISQRVGNSSYVSVLLPLLALWIIELVVNMLVFGTVPVGFHIMDPTADLTDSKDRYYYETVEDSFERIVFLLASIFFSVFTSLNSVTGLVMIIITCVLRGRVREILEIEGTCCDDCFFSMFCTCCVISQIATQVKSFRPKHCDFGPVDTLPAFLPQ